MNTKTAISSDKSGNEIRLPYWKVVLAYWTPFISIGGALLIAGGFAFNFDGRMFDNSEQKFNTINHTKNQEMHLTEETKGKLVNSKEFEDLKKQLEKMDAKLDEINKYLRK